MLLPMWVRRPPNTTASENGWVNENGIVVYYVKGLPALIEELRDELEFYLPALFDNLEFNTTSSESETTSTDVTVEVATPNDTDTNESKADVATEAAEAKAKSQTQPQTNNDGSPRKKPGPKPKSRR